MSAVLYNIYINQFAVLKNNINLDANDLIILEALAYLIRKTPEGHPISYDSIIDLIPILKTKSKKTIQRRVNNLINQGMIEKEVVNNNETFFKFGPQYHLLLS